MPRWRTNRRSVVMGALAAATGMGLGELVAPALAWWNDDALLDADYANGRFRWDGQAFDDEADFNAAIGGSSSGAQRVIGPYVDPAAPELIVNGDFAAGLTGWSNVLNGTSTAAIAAGALKLTSDAATGNGAGGAGIA